MIQAKTQSAEYWGSQFNLSDSDIEQIYNHLLEVEKPQTIEAITRVVMTHRVATETQNIQRRMQGRVLYQPQNSYAVGDQLVFPEFQFAQGSVTAVRDGYNPEEGRFQVIAVDIANKSREFAAAYTHQHPLNLESDADVTDYLLTDLEALYKQFGVELSGLIETALAAKPDFIRIENMWFAKSLLLDINIGHLHLSEAVLEINEGGPMSPEEMIPFLDLDPAVDISVQRFSLNTALVTDERFDEVAPAGEIAWFLHRLEPDEVKETPARLKYQSEPYDRALLNSQLQFLEQELDDEWSDMPKSGMVQPAVLALTFPHRWSGTLPLSSRMKSILPQSSRPRQRVLFVDEETQQEIVGWVVKDGRYIYGLKEWYEEFKIPVGGFLHFSPGPKPGVIMLGFDRRRAQREWVRLASVSDNRIQFTLERRSISCGYDDLLIVGTDVVAAIDALWRRAETNKRSLASLLMEIFPSLASLNPQNAVHAKTLYSAVNMLKRMPPGPIFAELTRNSAFESVGDLYWQFNKVN